MSKIELNIYLSPEELQKAYGGVDRVSAISVDGRRVHFPANILWPFITHDGVVGRFLIEFDQDNKFKDIQRLS